MKLPSIATKKQKLMYEYGLKHDYSLLCADPRLGKTVVAIYLQKTRNVNCLVVCPGYLVPNWRKEINKWSPFSQVTTFTSGKEIYEPCDSDFVIISYDLVQKAEHLFEWADMIVADECFTGDMEILTDRGFKRFDSLTKTERVAQFGEATGGISFIRPDRYIEKDYSGEIIDMVSRSGVDVSVTPNHDMYLETGTGTRRKKKAGEFKKRTVGRFISCGLASGKDIELSTQERFAIAFQADGSFHSKRKAAFSFSRDRKISEFESLVKDCGIPMKEVKPGGTNKKRYMVDISNVKVSKNLWDIFSLPDLSLTKARAIIEEMVKWDGSVVSDTNYYYSSKIKDNRDFYQSVAAIAGYRSYGSLQIDNRYKAPCYVYRLSIRKDSKYCDLQGYKITRKDYQGKVYCVTVPSGLVVVRRNGKVIVCGNCHNLKSMSAKRTQFFHKALYENSIKYFHGLTGTPLKNRVREFYSILALANYDPKQTDHSFLTKYPDEILFAEQFSNRQQFEVKIKTKRGASFYKPIVKYEGIRNIPELKSWLKGKYIRIRADKGDLPPVSYLDTMVANFNEPGLIKAFNKFFEDDANHSVRPDIKVQAANKKAPLTIKYVENLVETVDCCLVYSDHKEPIQLIAKHFNVPAITGEMPAKRRAQLVKDFQEGRLDILCSTIGALKEGADLFRARDIVFNDPCWTPGDLTQVINRMRAIGEKDPRTVHRMLGSPQDEKIYSVLENKMKVIDAAT
jgi:hypothetical protein